MQRRTAVAAASAISVSLVSAVIAGAASFGALGFAAPSSSSTPPTAVTVSASNGANDRQPVPSQAPTSRTRESERGEGGRTETQAPQPTGGHESDD
jgi:hypothetical protein